MRRTVLLTCLLCVLTAGCVERTGDPPPYPQPTFEFETGTDDGTTTLRITVTHPNGPDIEPVRILVGDRIAYVNESYRSPFTESGAYENEWTDGIESGDSITVSKGSSLGDDVLIQLRRADTGEFVTVGSHEPPYGPTSDSSSSR
jgi:hypothetical protein